MQARHPDCRPPCGFRAPSVVPTQRVCGSQFVLPKPVTHCAAVDTKAIRHRGDRQAFADEILQHGSLNSPGRRVLGRVDRLETVFSDPVSDGGSVSIEALADLRERVRQIESKTLAMLKSSGGADRLAGTADEA